MFLATPPAGEPAVFLLAPPRRSCLAGTPPPPAVSLWRILR